MSCSPKKSWSNYEGEYWDHKVVHVVPDNDDKEHVISGYCACGPRMFWDDKIMVHNSYDFREVSEYLKEKRRSPMKDSNVADERRERRYTETEICYAINQAFGKYGPVQVAVLLWRYGRIWVQDIIIKELNKARH